MRRSPRGSRSLTTATVIGTTIEVVGIDIADHGDALTARCHRGDVVQDLHLSDLVFAPAISGAGQARQQSFLGGIDCPGGNRIARGECQHDRSRDERRKTPNC